MCLFVSGFGSTLADLFQLGLVRIAQPVALHPSCGSSWPCLHAQLNDVSEKRCWFLTDLNIPQCLCDIIVIVVMFCS